MDLESLSRLSEAFANIKLPPTTFICPYCGKEHNITDAKVEKILASSKHVSTKISGRIVTRTYQDSYYKVRFCAKCYKRKKRTKTILYSSILALSTILYGIHYFRNLDGSILGFLGFLVLLYFLVLLGIGVLNWILDKTIYDVDFESAVKNNAIEPLDYI